MVHNWPRNTQKVQYSWFYPMHWFCKAWTNRTCSAGYEVSLRLFLQQQREKIFTTILVLEKIFSQGNIGYCRTSDFPIPSSPANDRRNLDRLYIRVVVRSFDRLVGRNAGWLGISKWSNNSLGMGNTYSHTIRLDWSSGTPFDPWPKIH